MWRRVSRKLILLFMAVTIIGDQGQGKQASKGNFGFVSIRPSLSAALYHVGGRAGERGINKIFRSETHTYTTQRWGNIYITSTYKGPFFFSFSACLLKPCVGETFPPFFSIEKPLTIRENLPPASSDPFSSSYDFDVY